MDLETLKLDLNGLNDGLTSLSFDLDDSFFDAVEAPEVSKGKVHVDIDIVRTDGDFFSLAFRGNGMVIVPCDRCLEDMEVDIDTCNDLTVLSADRYEDADDVIYVEQDRKELDLWPFIYDFIALAIPLTHSHTEGQCNPDMEARLSQYMVTRQEDSEEPED